MPSGEATLDQVSPHEPPLSRTVKNILTQVKMSDSVSKKSKDFFDTLRGPALKSGPRRRQKALRGMEPSSPLFSMERMTA